MLEESNQLDPRMSALDENIEDAEEEDEEEEKEVHNCIHLCKRLALLSNFPLLDSFIILFNICGTLCRIQSRPMRREAVDETTTERQQGVAPPQRGDAVAAGRRGNVGETTGTTTRVAIGTERTGTEIVTGTGDVMTATVTDLAAENVITTETETRVVLTEVSSYC